MSSPILVLNCGSSSVKYQMIDALTEEVLAKGLVEKIGDPSGVGKLTHTVAGEDHTITPSLPNHYAALDAVVAQFTQYGPDLADCVAVAHRTVHGGTKFKKTTLVSDEMIETLKELSPLAPLHNPPGIAGIEAARAVLPSVPHIAVFDTAFFSNLPAESYLYAIDSELAKQYSIRKYGFHGTSHAYVSAKVAEVLGTTELNQIICHLGNGASVSAVKNGEPYDTSMGITPLAGLVMGTRPGDLDPGLHFYLAREVGMSIDGIDNLFNKRSGMFGLTGMTDMRDIETACNNGDERAIQAMDLYYHRLVFYIGAYHALLGGAQAITFTAGIGENSSILRAGVIDRLAGLGVKLDAEANAVRSPEPRVISTPDSTIKVLVVPTNEELAMARQAYELLS